MRTSWRHTSRSDLLPSSDSVPHHTPSHKTPSPNPGETPVWFIPAEFRPRINAFCRCLSSYPSINWHYSNHSCPHAQRHKQPPPPPSPTLTPTLTWAHTLTASWVRLLTTSTACRLSQPTSPAIYSTFFQPTTVDESHPAPPCMSSHFSPHSVLTFIQNKEHTPSSCTVTLSCLYPLPAVFNTKLSATWKARENHYCSNSHIHQSILFHSSSLHCVFIIEGLAWNWIVLGFHGRRLWLVQRERLFVAFDWRQPSFLLLFTPNGHQNCWTSRFFIYSAYMQTLYVTQSHCKQCDYIEKAQVEMLFHLNSRIHWELCATQAHIHLQSDNRSSGRKEQILLSLAD